MPNIMCRTFLNFHSLRHRSTIQHVARTLPQKLLDREKGQHLLRNDTLLQKIVDSAHLSESDVVLEIGSGSGNITLRILEQCAKVYAVDVDAKLTHILHKRVHKYYDEFAPKLHCIIGDVLQMDIPNDIDHIISNAPFQISSELIFKLLSFNYFKSAILVFQEEFIQKLTCNKKGKQYSRLSVNAQMHCKIERLFNIDRSHFQPPPHVDTAVVRLTPYNNDNNPWISEEESGKYEYVSLLLHNYGKYTNIEDMDQDLLKKRRFEYEQWNEFLKICFLQKNKKLPTVFDNTLQKMKHRIRYVGNRATYGDNVAIVLKDLFQKQDMTQCRANGTDIASFLTLFDAMRSHDIQFHA
eukprot:221801_1